MRRWMEWRKTIHECGGMGICNYCGARRPMADLYRTYGETLWCLDQQGCQARWYERQVNQSFDMHYSIFY